MAGIFDLYQEVEQRYSRYRESGTALSATIIILSSGLFAWTYDHRFNLTGLLWWISLFSMILSICAIVAALFIQYCQHKGRMHHAQQLYNQSTEKSTNQWFSRQDKMVEVAFWGFCCAGILAIIFRTLEWYWH